MIIKANRVYMEIRRVLFAKKINLKFKAESSTIPMLESTLPTIEVSFSSAMPLMPLPIHRLCGRPFLITATLAPYSGSFHTTYFRGKYAHLRLHYQFGLLMSSLHILRTKNPPKIISGLAQSRFCG